MSLRGVCNNGKQNTLTLVNLLNTTECSIESRNIITIKKPLYDTISENRINYYYNETIPFFDSMLTSDDTAGLELKYAMYRDVITCLYKKVDANSFFNKKTYNLDSLKIKEMISISVYVFINMKNVFNIQNAIQTYLLIVNVIIVSFNVCMVIFRVVKVCIRDKHYGHKCVYLEVYFSFILDLVNAIVGAASYFTLNEVVNYTNYIIDTGCMGNYEGAKLDAYAGDLFSTADQNFQMFLVMVMKLTLILINIFYYIIVKKCKISCSRLLKLIYENIHEGDEEDAPESSEEIMEDQTTVLNKFFEKNAHKNLRNDFDKSENGQLADNNSEKLSIEGHVKNEFIEKAKKKKKLQFCNQNNDVNGKENCSNRSNTNNSNINESDISNMSENSQNTKNKEESFTVKDEYVVRNVNEDVELKTIKIVDDKCKQDD